METAIRVEQESGRSIELSYLLLRSNLKTTNRASMVSELIWSIYCSSQDLAGYYLHERIEKKVSPYERLPRWESKQSSRPRIIDIEKIATQPQIAKCCKKASFSLRLIIPKLKRSVGVRVYTAFIRSPSHRSCQCTPSHCPPLSHTNLTAHLSSI